MSPWTLLGAVILSTSETLIQTEPPGEDGTVHVSGGGSGPNCGMGALLPCQQNEVSRPCAIQEDKWEIFTVTLQEHTSESYQGFRKGWIALEKAMVRNFQDGGSNWKSGISHITTNPLLQLCFCN